MHAPSESPEPAATQRNEEAHPPIVAPCRTLPWNSAFGWLRAGARDMRRAPGLSMLFGAVIVLVSMVIAALAWKLGRFALLATLLSGFVYVAPLIAVGLYCVSRELELGRTPGLAASFVLARRVLGQAAIFALGQGVIILLWSRAGMVLAALSPIEVGDQRALMEYLAIGSAVGGLFAALTFAVAVVSLPFIADRDVDMVTAALSSINAVLRNKPAMLVWGAVIVLLTVAATLPALLGAWLRPELLALPWPRALPWLLPLLAGLGVVMPWLAYSSWHAYRATLEPDAWPRLA